MSAAVRLGDRVTFTDGKRERAGEVITLCDKGKTGVRVRCDDEVVRFKLRFNVVTRA